MIEKIRDDLYVQKGRFGYSIAYPAKRDLSKPLFAKGNVNWKHLLIGSWGRLFIFLFIFALLMFGVWSYQHDVEQCVDVLENPCEYFDEYCTPERFFDPEFNIEGDNGWETIIST